MSRRLSPVGVGAVGPAVALTCACGEAIERPHASVAPTRARAVGGAGTLDRDHAALTGHRAVRSARNRTQPVARRAGL